MIFWAIVLVIVAYVIYWYNSVISLKNTRDTSLSDIDIQMKLRFDLLPNLVEIVKGYAKHESAIFDTITSARSSWNWAKTTEDKIGADNMLTGALKSLFALSESTPELKANQNFLEIQSELSDIENKIAAARRFFNNVTNEYNTYIQSFPSNVLCGFFGFQKENFFTVEDRASLEKVPEIKF